MEVRKSETGGTHIYPDGAPIMFNNVLFPRGAWERMILGYFLGVGLTVGVFSFWGLALVAARIIAMWSK